MRLDPVVGLEIGTSKVIALVGDMREDGHVMITGMGQQPSLGIRKGEVRDLERAAASVQKALAAAEESGEVTIRQVYLTVSGGRIESLVNRGTVPVVDPQGGITDDDIEQVIEVARSVSLPTDRQPLHTIRQLFTIDDQTGVTSPKGMTGSRLTVDMLIVHGLRSVLSNTVKVVTSLRVDVQDVVFGALCCALSVLGPEQKARGVIVIDLGGGTTSFLTYADNTVSAAGSIPLGGDHITNDIALAFNIPLGQAEQLKCELGNVTPAPADRNRKVSLPPDGGFPGGTIPLHSLQEVIRLRVEEILTLVRRRIEKDHVLPRLGAGVVLTGGGAHLRGITSLVEDIFGLSCSIGHPRNVSGLATAVEGPEYAACAGAVQYGFKVLQDRINHTVMGRLRHLFRRSWLSSDRR
ncbi:MAG: cell division protein FtsA [Kiritimatiellae bacterium]|nr:cell division protein FtsA [Kiritimatiellia bacterium]